MEMGFSQDQAGDAARRCSSLEAAVDWINMHSASLVTEPKVIKSSMQQIQSEAIASAKMQSLESVMDSREEIDLADALVGPVACAVDSAAGNTELTSKPTPVSADVTEFGYAQVHMTEAVPALLDNRPTMDSEEPNVTEPPNMLTFGGVDTVGSTELCFSEMEGKETAPTVLAVLPKEAGVSLEHVQAEETDCVVVDFPSGRVEPPSETTRCTQLLGTTEETDLDPGNTVEDAVSTLVQLQQEQDVTEPSSQMLSQASQGASQAEKRRSLFCSCCLPHLRIKATT